MAGLGHVYLLVGGRATGKSTLLPYLVAKSRGPIVLDMDELLDDGWIMGHRMNEHTSDDVWLAFENLWTRIVQLVRRSGHPVIFMCPTPSPDAFANLTVFEDPVHWARLGCPREVRRQRLLARGWTDADAAAFLDDPGHEQIARLIPNEFRTDLAPAQVADQVLRWVTGAT